MKPTKNTNTEIQESTYALRVRSEEKERSLLESIAYGVCILSDVAAISQFVLQPINLPVDKQTVSATQPAVDVRS